MPPQPQSNKNYEKLLLFLIRHPHLLSGFSADSDNSINNDDDINKIRDIRGDTYDGGHTINLEFESQVDSNAFKNNYYEVRFLLKAKHFYILGVSVYTSICMQYVNVKHIVWHCFSIIVFFSFSCFIFPLSKIIKLFILVFIYVVNLCLNNSQKTALKLYNFIV